MIQCLVCQVAHDRDRPCPNCGYEVSGQPTDDTNALPRAREAWRLRTLAHAPETRVRLLDKLGPWAGLVLGAVLFLFWIRACSGPW